MRLGLISDVHGDLAGLTQALDLLHARGAETILCAGDLVEKGDAGGAVIDLIRRQGIPCVRGNHDVAALGNQKWLRENGDPTNPNYHARLIPDDALMWLDSLPMRLSFQWGGHRVLMAHGTPSSYMEYLYPNSPPDLFKRVASEAGADFVILGHTHRPMRVDVAGITILNPGSIFSEGSGTCGLLDTAQGAFDVLRVSTGMRVPDSDVRSLRIQ